MIKIEKRLKQEKLQESMEQEVSGKMNRDSRWQAWSNRYRANIYIIGDMAQYI